VSFLELQQLKKVFPDGTEAVKGIDLHAEAGEFVVLLGPSGCGKTTTLRMIAGLEMPTSGRIAIAGRNVTMLRPSERDVGFVFQFYALYPHLSVAQNIGFPLEAAGVRRAERDERVRAVARSMGLLPLLECYPRQLSGGDQQRVSLARAVVRHPAIFLMDEPLGTLDADQRLEMREFIRGRQQEMKVTTIYVTHDQEEAMSLADRIVVMQGGTICQAGPAAEVYDDPASLFVANFVGSPGMNFIPGHVRAHGGRCVFMPDRAQTPIPLKASIAPGPATLGIRPEFLHASPQGPISGTVVMNEYQGSFRSIHIDAGFTGTIAMRAGESSRLQPGQKIRLDLDAAHARFFDTQSGRRIGHAI